MRIGLRSTSDAGLAMLLSWLPRTLRPGRARVVDALYSLVEGGEGGRVGMKRFHVLYRDATRLERSLDPAELRRTFNRDISMLIGALARRRVFVHAGVVGIDGKAVLVPGRSFSGKTTLVQALVQQGAVYYSDEYAVLDSRGRVWPWAESLSIRAHGPAKPGDLRSPESLGAVAGKRALPVRLVVLTSFEEGRSFKPRTVSPAAGTLGLLQHTLPARRRPRRSLQALASVVSEARVVRGRRGDAHQAARVIVRMLANSRRP